MSKSERD